MATLGPNYISGITTSVNNTDIVYKQYVNDRTAGIATNTDADAQKILKSDGSTTSWDFLSERLEFETAGTTNNTVPSQVNKILISASGGGGGGGAGEVDGAKVPRLTSWTQRTGSFSSYSYYYYGSITYGNSPSGNKWVNTGQGARIESSTDAIHWTTRTSGNSSNSQYWWDGIYANNEFLLVGYNYAVIASTDAIHWFSRTANFGVQYKTVAYGADGNYCIAGDSGRILASTDAVHWKQRTSPQSSDNRWVGYLNNGWHMCGQSNTYSASTDTIHWSKRTIPNTYDNETMSYHAGKGIYLIFKQYAYYENDNVGHGIYASTDSINWVARTSDFGGRQVNYQFYASEYVPSIQTVVACGSYVSAVSSTDTIHWSYSRTHPTEGGSEENYDIATDDSEKVMITGRYNVMLRESVLKSYAVSGGGGAPSVAPRYEINGDSISKLSTLDVTVGAGGRGGGNVHSQQWTLRTMGISTNRLEQNGYPAVQYNGYWVVGSKISASTDSIHWSARTLPPLPASTQAWGVAYGDLLLMTSGDNYFLCTSTDSIVWTLRTTSIDDNRQMFYDGKGSWLVAGGPSGDTPNGLVVSTDSIHWKRRTLGASVATQTGFAYNGDAIYVVGTYDSGGARSNGLSSSTDTIHWTKRTIGFGALNTKKVNYNFKTQSFYVVGEGNGLFASTDAIHWAKRTVPFSNANVIYSYSTGYNQHVIGSGNGVATSTDSINWTLRTHNFVAAEPRYIGYGDEKFMVTNSDGSNNNEISILDVSAEDGEDTTISWKGKGTSTNLTVSGNVSVDTTIKPTGASSSYYFDGTTDNLQISNASTLSGFTGDFTIEFWFRGSGSAQNHYAVFLETYEGSSGQKWAIQADGNGTNMIWVRDGDIKITTSAPSGVLAGAWHHHAVVRSGSTITYYIDGVSRGTESHSGTLSACTNLIIGDYSGDIGNYEIEGYLSNVRIINGEALYTSSFTPPTSDLQFTENTVLLTCNGNSVSAFDFSQTYTITVPGGKGANKSSGGEQLDTSNIGYGYRYFPNTNYGYDNNTAPGEGTNGASGDASARTDYASQGPAGGGAGGAAVYPSKGFGSLGQRMYVNQSTTSNSGIPDTTDGDPGYRQDGTVFGTGGEGGSAQSTLAVGAFSRRTFYIGTTSWSSTRMTGNYVEYLDLFVLANNDTSNSKSTTNLQVSTDSIHWTLRTYPFPGNSGYNWTSNLEGVRNLDSDGTQVVASSTNNYNNNGHTIAASTDTIHWTLRTMGAQFNDPNNVVYGNNLWIVTYNTTNRYITSTDTIHWKLRTFGVASRFMSLVYGNGRWVATHNNGGNPYTSTDAIHWKARTAGMHNSYAGYRILYSQPSDGENIFVYGNYKNIAWSTDGIRWFKRSQNNMHYIYTTSYSKSNTYLMHDYYGYIYEFDASGPLEDLFPENKVKSLGLGFDSGMYYTYNNFSNDKVNVTYVAGSSYTIKSNIMSVGLGNGGTGGPGAGGGGASVMSKASLSGHGGDGGDGSVHISMI